MNEQQNVPAEAGSTTEVPSGPEGAANWRWLYADEAGVATAGPDVAFATQGAAEDWLGEEFGYLSESGIATVTLMDGEHAVYGPMYLTPDGGGAAAEAQF